MGVTEVEEFRSRMEAYRSEGGQRRPYPEDLRQLALSYAKRRQSEGGSVEAIAEELGIATMTLWGWLNPEYLEQRRERRRAKRSDDEGVKVLPVRTKKQKAAPSKQLELSVGGGVSVRFTEDTDPKYVAALLAALRSA